MDISFVPETDQPNHGQGSNSTAASSATNISLSLDLRIHMPSREVGGECTHFVMRQYVAKMREKDRNKCLPLAYSDCEIEQLLPSMEVPKYKYWYCHNCLNVNGAVSSLENIVEARDKEGDSSEDRECALKERSLEALIKEIGNSVNSHCGTEGSPSISIPRSKGTQRGFIVPQRKRKAPNGKEKNRPSNLRKEGEGSKGNSNMGDKETEIINLDSESDPEGNVEATRKGSDTQCNRPFDLTLKDGIDHGKAGHGVHSLLSPEENRIFHKNHKRKYNIFAGESSVLHKSTTGPSFEESLKNVIDRFSLSNVEVSPLPSNKNIPMVKNLDFSHLRKDNNQTNGNVIAFPKGTETGILPWLQTDSLNTISNLAPTNGNCHDWPEYPRNNFNNIGQMKNQSFVYLFGKPLAACNKIEKKNLVEKELFPNSSLKSRPDKSSSSLNSSQFPVKLFSRIINKEKAKGSYVPVVSPNGVDSVVSPLKGQTIFDPVGPLTLGPSYMQGRVVSLTDRTPIDMCTINMNPADFSYPNARNPFMINGAELKVGSRGRSRGKSVREKGIGRTKQRVKKTT